MYQNSFRHGSGSCCFDSHDSFVRRLTTKKNSTSWRRIRIRRDTGSGSSSYYVFWLILSVSSSMAVMAHQNDLAAISSVGNARHGCVWSRTDESSASSNSNSNNSNSISNEQQGMYALRNNPFQQQQQRTFPSLSSSFLGSSAGGSGRGVHTLNCNVRTLNSDFQNLTREQVEQASVARVNCNDKMYFESVLDPNLFFRLGNLRELEMNSCKIRKIPSGVFSKLTRLKRLTIQTNNFHWSPSIGVEIESGAFEGLADLEELDLSSSNLWLFPDKNLFCSLRSLLKLNISHNRLTDLEELGLGASESSAGGSSCALNIQNLDISHNSLRQVPDAFNRVRKLSALNLEANLIEELEDTAFSNLDLKLLNIASNRLVALPPTIFNSSSSRGSLREIYLQNNSISALSPQVFKGLDQLLLLDLSMNSISGFPSISEAQESIFSSLIRLVVLKLNHNHISYIDKNLFSNLISLQVLSLSNNKITSIDPDAFSFLANLHILELSNNLLSTIDSRHFSHLFVLRQLFLDSNQLKNIHHNAFKNCSSLSDMGLSKNLLQEVPLALRDLGQLKTLDIGENLITSITNESFPGQLYGLRMVDNKLSELSKGFCDSMKNLRVLNLNANRIRRISPAAFTGCPALQALRLDSNALEELPTLSPELSQLLWLNVSENRLKWTTIWPSVEWLDISRNQIELIQVPQVQRSKNNRTTYNLRVLDASYNKLKSLDPILMQRLELLDTLRVNYNQVRSIAPDTFRRASQLRRAELIGNSLENLSLSALRLSPVASGKSLPDFYIGGNPFVCDCSMEWLQRINQLTLLRQHPRIVDLDAIVCRPTFSRRSNQLVPLMETKPSDFLCAYTEHCFALCECCDFDYCDCRQRCPTNCTCYHDSSWSANIVDCSRRNSIEIPSNIPMDSSEIHLDGNKFSSLNSHVFIGKKNLRILYLNDSEISTIRNKTFNGLKHSLEILHLENNFIDEIQGFEFDDLHNLRQLFLQNNNIKYIEKNTFSKLSLNVLRLDGNRLVNFPVWELGRELNSVALANNPWTCDCKFLVPFRNWASTKYVTDILKTTCQPTTEHQPQELDRNGTNSNVTSTTVPTTASHTTIISMCYNLDKNPVSLSLDSSTSTVGGSNMNNHISSVGGASRSSIGSTQLSGPYHHTRPENQEQQHRTGNYQQGFPHNGNMITAAGEERKNKEMYDGDSGVTTLTCLLIFLFVIILVTITVFLVVKRRREKQWGCFNGTPKCLSTPNSSTVTNERPTSGDTDCYYYSENEKLFDMYLIYSHKDDEFVREKFLPELQQGWSNQHYYTPGLNDTGNKKLRVCLHYDLCLGPENPNPWSTEIILSACNASKRLVLLISNNLANGDWTNNNFKIVLGAIKQSVIVPGKVIIIKMPDVSDRNASSICSAIEQQQQQRNSGMTNTSSTSPLVWGSKSFWPTFRHLLPNPQQISSIANNNRSDISVANLTSTLGTPSQLPYITNGMNFINSTNNGTTLMPLGRGPGIGTLGHDHHHYHQPSGMLSNQQHFITMMNWPGQPSVHPVPSQLTPQPFGYSNINNVNSQQPITFSRQQHQQDPRNFHRANNTHQTLPLPPGGMGHIHSLSLLSDKTPIEGNYSSSAVSSGNEEYHVYSTLDSPLESPCSDLGPGHLGCQFDGAMINQVNRHQIQHSTSSGISSESDATSGTGGCHPEGGGNCGPAMYFV